MSLYSDYLTQIENRKKEGLKPKPIEDGELLIKGSKATTKAS